MQETIRCVNDVCKLIKNYEYDWTNTRNGNNIFLNMLLLSEDGKDKINFYDRIDFFLKKNVALQQFHHLNSAQKRKKLRSIW